MVATVAVAVAVATATAGGAVGARDTDASRVPSKFFFFFFFGSTNFFFFRLDYMCINFTIPTTLMHQTMHQIAAVTTAGEAVGAQDVSVSQALSKFFFFFFFGSTNVFFFYFFFFFHLDYTTPTTSTCPTTHQMAATITTCFYIYLTFFYITN